MVPMRSLAFAIARHSSSRRGFCTLQPSSAEKTPSSIPTEEVVLYRSNVDVAAVVAAAYQRCWLGVGMGAVGFVAVCASAAPTATPAHFGLLLLAAAGNSYSQLVYKPERLKTLAMRHVEQLSVMRPIQPVTELLEKGSTEEAPEVSSSQGSAPDAEAPEVDSANSHWIESATELNLKIRCANINREVLLASAAAPWEGARFSGLVADDRVTFNDLVANSRLLHIETETGDISDSVALESIISSGKLVDQEQIELREDVASSLRLSSKHVGLLEARLAEVNPKDVQRMASLPPPLRESPAVQIQGIGNRAFAMGIAILGASFLFQFRPHATDPEKDFRLRYLIFDEQPKLQRQT